MFDQPLIEALRERRPKAHQRLCDDQCYVPELDLVWA